MAAQHTSASIDKLLTSKRKLPKITICTTRAQKVDLQNKMLFGIKMFDAKEVRRHKRPLWECLILESNEAGFINTADFLRDIIQDNCELLEADDIGMVVDLRKEEEYLLYIVDVLQQAEQERDDENLLEECRHLQRLADYFRDKPKGILWLAEKFYLAAIAVGSQYFSDGGRQKECCKFFYGKFLVERFPCANLDDPLEILVNVREAAHGRKWPLCYPDENEEGAQPMEITLYAATSIQLHKIYLKKAWEIYAKNPSKAEGYARLGANRATDAGRRDLEADALIMMGMAQIALKNLKRAERTLNIALHTYTSINNISGICEAKTHLACVAQKFKKLDEAVALLTEMGTLALAHGLRNHLGRALHLLGELYVQDQRPSMATEYFDEAFKCFMGFNLYKNPTKTKSIDTKISTGKLGQLYENVISSEDMIYDEANKSRFMTAVAAGLDIMPTYYRLLNRSDECIIAALQIIHWKLTRMGWWTVNAQMRYVPCLCSEHNRNILDTLAMRNDSRKLSIYGEDGEFEDYDEYLSKIMETDNFMLRRAAGEELLTKSLDEIEEEENEEDRKVIVIPVPQSEKQHK